jgi:hypothetical protein
MGRSDFMANMAAAVPMPQVAIKNLLCRRENDIQINEFRHTHSVLPAFSPQFQLSSLMSACRPYNEDDISPQ